MTTDPYQPEETLEGRLRGKQVPGGSVDARLSVSTEGILVTPEAGPAHTIPIQGMRLHRDDSQALVASQAGGQWSVTCADPNFFRALETVAGNHLNNQLARLEGQKVSSRGKHLIGCFIALAIIGGMIWAIPSLFNKGVDATVESLPHSLDKTLGEAAQSSMDPGGTILDDEAILEPLQKIFDRLTPHAEMEGIEYKFRVVQSEVSNAYALPGGFITIFTGLIKESDSAEEVAGVLAHEIAHVYRRHGLRRVAQNAGLMVSLSLLFGNLGGLEKIALDLFTLAQVNDISQDHETDADLIGLRILVDARIDPRGLTTFFAKMKDVHGDQPKSISWASSHPRFDDRIETIERNLEEMEGLPQWEPLDVDWPALKEALDAK